MNSVSLNSARLQEQHRLYAEKMLAPEEDVTLGLTWLALSLRLGLGGCLITLMDYGFIDLLSVQAQICIMISLMLLPCPSPATFRLDIKASEEGVIRIYDILFEDKVLLIPMPLCARL